MMKDRLYTVNKWNKNLFAVGGNKWEGLAQQYWTNNGYNWDAVKKLGLADQYTQDYMNTKGGWFNMTKEANPFSKGNIGTTMTGIGTAAANVLSPFALNGISSGYSTGGVGEGIAGVGGAVGNAVGGPWGAAITLGSSVLGGLTNRAWGLKKNDENINAIEQNTLAARNAGNALASANSNEALLNSAGQMTTGTGFGTTDLVKGGWFAKNRARRKGQRYLNAEENALAAQTHGLTLGVQGADTALDDEVMGNFAAFGGPIGMAPTLLEHSLTGDNDGMGAIEYGFMNDWLLTKKKQQEKERMNNLEAKPQGTVFDIGGVLQSNSADFSTGAMHIGAGDSHEMNPNGGVQVGVDPEGVPNLVEEGEVIYNDYVYSNRIKCDAMTKEKFHFSKKKDITFADAAKKLEGEISERPNDPISKAGFKTQMAALAEEQERQKAEMEAERAREAFEALSPEEQVALMQQTQAPSNLTAPSNLPQLGEATVAEGMIPGGEAPGTVGAEEAASMMQQSGQDVMACGGKVNRYDEGGVKKRRNVGTWKDEKENHWDVFTRPGLKKYLEHLKERIDKAPDEATKDLIRRTAMNELNSLQQSYFSHVLPGAGATRYDYSDDIRNHQKLFDDLYGNTGFYSIDDNGNVKNLIADAINLPQGAATEDKPDNWVDGYNGRRTSIRNFGSTEYGDDNYYKDLVDEFANLGLTYAPNDNWKYGENRLYGLSLPEMEKAAEEPKVWDATKGDFVTRAGEGPEYNAGNLYGAPWAPGDEGARSASSPGNASGTVGDAAGTAGDAGNGEPKPVYRAEWPRYAGLFGPLAGLGLMAAGVGKPDTKAYDSILEGYDRTGAALADYRPIGNYLTYRPMDIWAEQNRLNANSRGTERGILNSGASQGAKMAGLLASGYNDQIASGELYRKGLEYNDALRERAASFNKDTDKFNAEAYNRTAITNAEILNRQRQMRTQLGMQAAAQRADADAAWANGIYGNVAGLFKGLGELGRENAQHNMIAEMAADGIFGPMSPKTNVGKKRKYLKWS